MCGIKNVKAPVAEHNNPYAFQEKDTPEASDKNDSC